MAYHPYLTFVLEALSSRLILYCHHHTSWKHAKFGKHAYVSHDLPVAVVQLQLQVCKAGDLKNAVSVSWPT
jgi:hypothetical protein